MFLMLFFKNTIEIIHIKRVKKIHVFNLRYFQLMMGFLGRKSLVSQEVSVYPSAFCLFSRNVWVSVDTAV